MTKQAFGIVSLLDVINDKSARLIWKRACDIVGKYGLTSPQYPHFSWQVAVNYQIENIQDALTKISISSQPFKISISGVGIFPGLQPIIYLTIVRNETLNQIHQKIWVTCNEYGIELSPYYTSERWIPHITIAYNPLSPIVLSSIIEEMAFENWESEVVINNLAIAYQIGDEAGVAQELFFGKEIQ